MKKLRRIIIGIIVLSIAAVTITGCNNEYYTDLSDEANVKWDIAQVFSYVNVASGFFATYASVLPVVFIEDEFEYDYEIINYEGKDVYLVTVKGNYHPDYTDGTSSKYGEMQFLMDLANPNKDERAMAPWPYKDPDRIDDSVWRYVTHKDVSERPGNENQ